MELSPHPLLTAAITDTIDTHTTARLDTPAAGSVAIASLRRTLPEHAALATAIARLHNHGHSPHWHKLYPHAGLLPLPTYPFQHQRYSLVSPTPSGGDIATAGLDRPAHPLVGAVTALADEGGWVFTGRLSLRSHPWLADHVVADTIVLPATGWADLALHAGEHTGTPTVAELILHRPLILATDTATDIQIHLTGTGTDGGDARQQFTIHSHTPGPDSDGEGGWVLHASGQLTTTSNTPAVALPDPWPPQDTTAVAVADLYDTLAAENNYRYGSLFQGLRAAWRDSTTDTVYAEVELPPDTDTTGYGIHPALLDAALHPVFLLPTTGTAAPAMPMVSVRVRMVCGCRSP